MNKKSTYLLITTFFIITACISPKEYPINGETCGAMFEDKEHGYWNKSHLVELCTALKQELELQGHFEDENTTQGGESSSQPN